MDIKTCILLTELFIFFTGAHLPATRVFIIYVHHVTLGNLGNKAYSDKWLTCLLHVAKLGGQILKLSFTGEAQGLNCHLLYVMH